MCRLMCSRRTWTNTSRPPGSGRGDRPMRAIGIVAALLLFDVASAAQTSWFDPALLERPDVKRAMQSVDDRAAAIVDEWIRLVEIPAPSRKEQARAQYIKGEMEKIGLADIRVADM